MDFKPTAGRAASGRGAESWADRAKGESERGRERARFGVCRGAHPGCLLSCTGKVGSRRSPLARPARASWRANISPWSWLSRCLGRCGYYIYIYFKEIYCSRNKTSSGCHRDRGQVVCLQSSGHPAWGRAGAGLPERSWRGLRAQLPPRTGCGAAESRIFMLYFKKI